MSTVKILEGFFKYGASAALVIDGEGNIVSEAYTEQGRVPHLSEAVGKVLSLNSKLVEGLNKGNIVRHQVHFADYQLHIETLDNGRNLVLVLGAKPNMGRIRLEIRNSKKNLEQEIATN